MQRSLAMTIGMAAASVGVAISTMILSIDMIFKGIENLEAITSQDQTIFNAVFLALSIIPLLAIPCCFFIDNQKAIQAIKK